MPEIPTSINTEATNTLYINNLNDKIPTEQLQSHLYLLFSTYGLILKMNFHGKIKGQSFIVFSDVNEARLSLRSLQGEKLFGKELKIAFSKSENHFIEKANS